MEKRKVSRERAKIKSQIKKRGMRRDWSTVRERINRESYNLIHSIIIWRLVLIDQRFWTPFLDRVLFLRFKSFESSLKGLDRERLRYR